MTTGATHVRIHRFGTRADNRYGVYRITVPMRIAKVIPDGTIFKPEITDEGLLFRFDGHADDLVVETPVWAEPLASRKAPAA